jgi:hypothetical protein
MARSTWDAEDAAKAAQEAEKEIPGLKTAEDVAKWVAQYYMRCGYKRLMRPFLKKFYFTEPKEEPAN